MSERGATGGLRIALAILVLLAIGAQLAAGIGAGNFSIVDYLSYFSILAGFIAGVVLLTDGAAALENHREPVIDELRGAVTMYCTVLLIFSLVIGHGLPPHQLGWAVLSLNYVLPIGLLIDWFAHPPQPALPWRPSLRWLIFPFLWVLYILLRGPLVDWYPYDMMNASQLGYGRVVLYLVLTFIGGALLSLCLVRIPQLYRHQTVAAKPSAKPRSRSSSKPPGAA